MRLPARLLLGAALTAALAACGRQDADLAAVSEDTAPVAQAPTQLTPEDRLARTATFLTARFGDAAQRGAAWRDTDGSRPLHRYLCLDSVVTWEGIETSVLGVCANRDDASDEEPGRLDVFFLRPDADGGLVVAAQLLAYPSGLGGVAAEPHLIALGPDQPALQLEQPVASDTVTRSDIVLLAALGAGLREVARFPASIDNRLHLHCGPSLAQATGGMHDNDHGQGAEAGAPDDHRHDNSHGDLAAAEAAASVQCDAGLIQLATTWQADAGTNADWWPLQIEQSGVACGSAVAQRHALVFDRARLTYSSAPLMEQCP